MNNENVDWASCTDEELIAEAKRRYPRGTVFIALNTDEKCVITTGVFNINSYGGVNEFDENNNYIKANGIYHCVFDSTEKCWSEIVSQPKEASLEAQKEFEENNPGMIFSKEPKLIHESMSKEERFRLEAEFEKSSAVHQGLTTPSAEPKAGDMVEGYRPGAFSDEWDKDQYYFTGGIAQSGLFICQDEQGEVKYFIKIRLPQKSEVESKAQELAEAYSMDPHKNFVNYLSDAIKWGQQNPSAK